ncbi:RluA family pseudouridine synthase [uncultured Helicobacter sp.]|uniref:RluA family pseudouridine synthase n=1 Tax=uncultured Helicobacter sp. TaxID=175537 RepID=UPI0026058631|nr:RluA family pseudouridine synthase [uncultured Helicobacter sp.]
MEKAYKLLSLQKHISHSQAKSLIDSGLVSANGRKLTLARTLLDPKTSFQIQDIAPLRIIEQKGDLLVVDKPAFLESYAIQARFQGYELLHRLDRETSGVLLLARSQSQTALEIIRAFKARKVEKIYYALVSGIIPESSTINAPILTKKGKSAKSKVHKDGLEAITHITPESIVGKKTLLRVKIETGRTHQIRVHLAHIGHPILGDTLYGGANAARLMLHASDIELLGMKFHAPLPEEFRIR